jgi:hypothetical protein
MATPAQPPAEPTHGVLFEDVRVFDGTSAHLSEPVQVLVIGNAIARIASEPIAPLPEVVLTVAKASVACTPRGQRIDPCGARVPGHS